MICGSRSDYHGIGPCHDLDCRFSADFDRYVVDGTVGGFITLASRAGNVLRNAQKRPGTGLSHGRRLFFNDLAAAYGAANDLTLV